MYLLNLAASAGSTMTAGWRGSCGGRGGEVEEWGQDKGIEGGDGERHAWLWKDRDRSGRGKTAPQASCAKAQSLEQHSMF